VLAEPLTDDSNSVTKKVDVSGSCAIEAGQIVAGRYAYQKSAPEVQHIWIGHAYTGLSVRARLNEHLSFLVSLEGRIWYNTSPMFLIPDNSSFGAPIQNFDIAIPNGEAIISFGDKERSAFTINIGRFEYKYNPQAQDLGEYLFRTGCYPAYIRTAFDLPLARLNGIAMSYSLFDFLRQDLLVTTMSEIRPFLDFNLTYIADFSAGKVFDVGAGISFEHLFSVDGNETINSYTSNGYLKSASHVNSLGDTIPGDTAFYKFAGIKLMLRFMFDPKRLFENTSFFGEKDCQIYAEAAILGLQDYPKSNTIDTANVFSNRFGYNNILEKIPVTLGFNWPTHPFLSYGLIPLAITMRDINAFVKKPVLLGGTGILSGIIAGGGTWLLEKVTKQNLRLDVLSVEGEWFGSKYKDSYENNFGRKPAPSLPQDFETDFDYLHDDWKWAIYAKKTILGGISLIGQVGRDHLRTETFIGQYRDFEESLVKNNQWYWMFKIKGNF
jgi:hypothetical protein